MNRVGRFVAGAQCPSCHEVDRLKVDVIHGEWRWCVACGFEERLPDAAAPAEDEATVVRFIHGLKGGAGH